MAQIFNILEDKVVIDKLALKYTEGSLIHAGSLTVVGQAAVQSNLRVDGTITADTIRVREIISESGGPAGGLNWAGSHLLKLDGDSIVITDLQITKTSGAVEHTGSLAVSGSASADSLTVAKTIKAETIQVKNIVTEIGADQERVFGIQNDKVVIYKAQLKYLEGSIVHAGSMDIQGRTSIQNDLSVKGAITADTIHVKNLVTEFGNPAEMGNWLADTEDGLTNRGFQWSSPEALLQVNYKHGKRLWTNGHIDLAADGTYRIDNTEVITATGLGPTITKSNIKELGALKSLNVLGNATLSEFAYFNAGLGRIGINTDQPNHAISILDGDIELALGAIDFTSGGVGTYSHHDFTIITDDTPRILVKKTGEVIVGDEDSKTASVTIHGTLHVDTLISDTRIERTSPIEFKTTRDSSIYNTGIIWTGNGPERQLVMKGNPDRIYSSETIDIDANKALMIGGEAAITAGALGSSITRSSLTQLGTLEDLTVSGQTTVNGNLTVTGTANLQSISFGNETNKLTFIANGVDATNNIALTVNNKDVFYSDADVISIGNKTNTRRPVKVYGPLSVGISNPDPTVSLAVSGDISFNNKKFMSAAAIPAEGTFNKGDICWNSDPIENGYVGWICVNSGTPGEWLPFGPIGR